MMTYDEVMTYFSANCKSNIGPNFQRRLVALKLLGNPEKEIPAVHVAGTNGKGSFTAMLSAILIKSGYRTGAFISPHLERYTERICIDGEEISREDFAAIFTEIITIVIPKLLADGLGHPNEFELLTIGGFLYFARKNVDIVVLETGLGGRNDPTVFGQTILSVIMPIGFDHCQILGNTIEAIAKEKAGIIKYRVPVVTAQQRPDVLTVLKKTAEANEAPLWQASRDYQLLEVGEDFQIFSLRTEHEDYPRLKLFLLGQYQLANASTVICACQCLREMGYNIDALALTEGLSAARWAGRMEYWALADGRGVLFDGAHNVDGIKALVEGIRRYYHKRPLVLLVGILADKAQEEMLRDLLGLSDCIFLTKPAEKRTENWAELAALAMKINPAAKVVSGENPREMLQKALAILPEKGVLCITGSLYLLGDLRRFLKENRENLS